MDCRRADPEPEIGSGRPDPITGLKPVFRGMFFDIFLKNIETRPMQKPLFDFEEQKECRVLLVAELLMTRGGQQQILLIDDQT